MGGGEQSADSSNDSDGDDKEPVVVVVVDAADDEELSINERLQSQMGFVAEQRIANGHSRNCRRRHATHLR